MKRKTSKIFYMKLISISLFFTYNSCFLWVARAFQKYENKLKVERIESFPEDDFLVWLGHSSFLFKVSGKVFYTDPVIYEKIVIIRRRTEFPAEVSKLPAPNFIIISHNHYDHMDIPSLKTLTEKSKNEGKIPVILVPEKASYYLDELGAKVVELRWEEEFNAGDVKIKSYQVKHFSGRNLFDWNFSKWNAYLVETEKIKIFFGGDTAYIKLPEILPDVALLPIGAWKPRWFMKRNHVSPCEAVQMAKDIKAKLVIPMHYGTFRQGLDTPEESLDEMKRCAEKLGLKYLIPNIGQIIKIEELTAEE